MTDAEYCEQARKRESERLARIVQTSGRPLTNLNSPGVDCPPIPWPSDPEGQRRYREKNESILNNPAVTQAILGTVFGALVVGPFAPVVGVVWGAFVAWRVAKGDKT